MRSDATLQLDWTYMTGALPFCSANTWLNEVWSHTQHTVDLRCVGMAARLNMCSTDRAHCSGIGTSLPSLNLSICSNESNVMARRHNVARGREVEEGQNGRMQQFPVVHWRLFVIQRPYMARISRRHVTVAILLWCRALISLRCHVVWC